MATKKETNAKGSVINDDDIEKAFEELSEEAELLQKAENEEVIDDEDEIEKDEDDDELDEEDGDEDDEEDGDEEEEKDEEDGGEEKEKAIGSKSRRSGKNNDIQKAIEVSPFLKAISDDIEAGQQKTRKVLGDVAVIMKGLLDRLDDLEGEFKAPRQPKSRVSKAMVTDRFRKGVDDEFEKADDSNEVSISDKRQIGEILDKLAFDDGKIIDQDFAKAISSFEATGIIKPEIRKKIEQRAKVKLVA